MKRIVSRSNYWFLLFSLTVLFLVPPVAFAETNLLQPVLKERTALPVSAASDLVVSNINMSPGKPTTNDKIIVWTFVKNLGPATTPPSSLQLQIGGKVYPLISVPGLPANQDWRYTAEVEPLTAQNYTITAIVNPQKQTVETNYDNNKRIKKFTVTVGPSVFIKNITWNRSTKVWVATVENATSAPIQIGMTGFPLENGVPGMTKWANTTLAGHGTFELLGDYSHFNVPVGTRLKVHVIKKNTTTVLDEKVMVLN
jgi:hypothetical protein